MFNYCPACSSQKISFEKNKVFRCPECGFTYYHNTAAATACIIRSEAGILFLVRSREPGRGKLDLPGGFVDPGEGAEEGLLREIKEELSLDLKGVSNPIFFVSFPNTYLYKNISYNTCDLFFCLDFPGLCEKDMQTEKSEISAVRFIKIEDLDMEEIAFESVKKAISLYTLTRTSFIEQS